MSALSDLPLAFAELAPLAGWAQPTEGARAALRRAATLDELKAFYAAMMPRLEAALDHLNGFPLADLPPAERRLMDLTLAFAEIAPYVEQYSRTSIPETFDEGRFVVLHEARQGWRP